jgi:hypothetical protein
VGEEEIRVGARFARPIRGQILARNEWSQASLSQSADDIRRGGERIEPTFVIAARAVARLARPALEDDLETGGCQSLDFGQSVGIESFDVEIQRSERL